ncbi:restriction endonuclease subunit S [Bacteroides thetaiotaomicron]|nr:restriction endonuclease subunit S [Bacteroides thetaiotaomicron]
MRFPEFSGEWKKCIIQDYGEVVTGNTPPTNNAEYYNNGSYLWASPADLGINKNVTDTKTKLSLSGFKKTRNVPKGSVLVTCIGSTIGKMGMATETMSSNQQINSVVVNDKNNSDFVYYAICRAFPRYLSEVGVQAVPILSKSNFEKLPNYTTSRDEQNKIGYFLSLLDERIATQNKIIDKLQSLISGLNDFLHLQVGGLSISFEELGTSYSGLSGKSGDDFGKGKPYITYLNIYSNSIVNEEQVDYVVIGDNEKQNTLLYGDLLFTLSSETPDEVGIGAVYLGESDKYYLNSFCFGLHMTATNKVYSPYLAYLVSNSVFRKFIYPLAQGSTRFNLQKNDFMKKKFLLPTFENQKEIARTLNALSSKLETERKLLLNYQEQKQYLLGAMFI